MATVVITPANVLASASATKKTGVAGATITAGQLLYKDTDDANKLKLADANGTALARVLEGIALHGAFAGQPITYIVRDPDFKCGGAVVIGQDYILASDTPGGLAPASDAIAGDYVTTVGVAKSVTNLNIAGFTAAGAAKA
jgi:hypothetical protein